MIAPTPRLCTNVGMTIVAKSVTRRVSTRCAFSEAELCTGLAPSKALAASLLTGSYAAQLCLAYLACAIEYIQRAVMPTLRKHGHGRPPTLASSGVPTRM
eukprot:scaffold401_cov399-Prasinococcus_capsulatus_cf.AAC.48